MSCMHTLGGVRSYVAICCCLLVDGAVYLVFSTATPSPPKDRDLFSKPTPWFLVRPASLAYFCFLLLLLRHV